MKRYKISQLLSWKEKLNRKPLIIEGARQVGKTWLMKEFGVLYYENTAYFNFDEDMEIAELFQRTKNPQRILENLSIYIGEAIKPDKTLIVFDEIQECPDALNALKYFYEKVPEYHVVCAGSLLGITIDAGKGIPVGKVEFLNLAPLSFTEFLDAIGENRLVGYMENLDELTAVPQMFSGLFEERLKQYYLIGGMPEAVQTWIDTGNISEVQAVLRAIIKTYQRDFSKHTTKTEQNKLTLVWESIPSQLFKENKKFIYSVIRKGARAKDYEFTLQWIVNAGLLQKVNRNSAHGIPLKAYDDPNVFKTYLLDVGLLSAMADVDNALIINKSELFIEFKGGLTENFICNSLYHKWQTSPKYWTSDAPKAEVDFLIQTKNELIPIEVKAAGNIRSKSLQFYGEQKHPKLKVRYSLKNLKLDGGVLNIPLYLVDITERLIDMALLQHD